MLNAALFKLVFVILLTGERGRLIDGFNICPSYYWRKLVF